MAFCTHCGAENQPGAAFCTKCGQPMAAQPQPAQPAAQPGPSAQQPVQQPAYQQTYTAPAAPRQPMKLELMSLIAGGLLILGGLLGLIFTCVMNPFYDLATGFGILNRYGAGNAIGGLSVWASIALILVWITPMLYAAAELLNGLLFHKKSRVTATLMQIGNYVNLGVLAHGFLVSFIYLICVIVFMVSYSHVLDGSPLLAMLIHCILALLLLAALVLLSLKNLRAQKQAVVSYHQHQMGYATAPMDSKLKTQPLALGIGSLIFGILSFFFCGFCDLGMGYAVAAFIMSLVLAAGYFFGFLSFNSISAQVAGQKAPDYKAAFDKMMQQNANKYVPTAAPAQEAQSPVQAAQPAQAAPQAEAQGFVRTAAGVRYPVGGQEIRLGSDPAQSGVQLSDPTGRISPVHCGIRFEKNQYLLVDYSATGTVVNGMRLTQGQPTYALPGSTVVLGESVTLTLE